MSWPHCFSISSNHISSSCFNRKNTIGIPVLENSSCYMPMFSISSPAQMQNKQQNGPTDRIAITRTGQK